MRSVAEGLVRRGTASAESDPRVFADHLAVRACDLDVSSKQQWAVRDGLNGGRLLRLLLRSAIEPPEMERPRWAMLDDAGQVVRLIEVGLDPRAAQGFEHPRGTLEAFRGVDA